MNTQIIILAAGKGKRMGDEERPKVLIPLKGKPVISYILQEVEQVDGTGKPILVVGYKHPSVRKALGPKYTYALQEQQLGTAHAVWAARPYVTAQNVLVLTGDMPFIKAKNIEKLMQVHRDQKATISMFTATAPNFDGVYDSLYHYGRIVRDKFGNIVKITEFKDATEEVRKIKEVNPSIYMFNTEWLWGHIDQVSNKNEQQEFYLTDLVEIAIQEEAPIRSFPISPKEVFGINTKSQLEQAAGLL